MEPVAGQMLTAGGNVECQRAGYATRRARPLATSRPALLLLTPILLLVFGSFFVSTTDPDYWWHVRTGQYIVETGAIPTADPYSFTAAGRPWVAHEWLTEVLFYGIEARFGYVGNVVLFGGLGAATMLLVYLACRHRGLGAPGATLLTLWGFVLILPLASVRPQMITLFLLATLALLLTHYKKGYSRALWPIPPLLVLWVNLHGGYVIGLVLLGLTCVGETLARARARQGAPLRPLFVVTALAAAATLCSPHGIEALHYPFTYAGSGNASMRFIAEWQSPDFHQARFLPFAASLLLALLVGLGRRPLGPTEALWTLLFALMGLQSIRHIPLYAAIVTPLIAARLATEFPRLRGTLTTWRRSLAFGAVLLAWLLPMALVSGVAATPEQRAQLQLGAEPRTAGYPAGAIAYLRDHDLRGNLFNQYHWGGYLIDQLYPERRVFIDGRADVYGDAFVTHFRDVMQVRAGWRETLNLYDIRIVLIEKDSQLAVALADDPAWQEVYAGEVERLFVRR